MSKSDRLRVVPGRSLFGTSDRQPNRPAVGTGTARICNLYPLPYRRVGVRQRPRQCVADHCKERGVEGAVEGVGFVGHHSFSTEQMAIISTAHQNIGRPSMRPGLSLSSQEPCSLAHSTSNTRHKRMTRITFTNESIIPSLPRQRPARMLEHSVSPQARHGQCRSRCHRVCRWFRNRMILGNSTCPRNAQPPLSACPSLP